MIDIIQALSEEGVRANEDLIWFDDTCVVLLDGSTSLLPSSYTARDFVQCYQRLFAANIQKVKNLPEAINMSICEFRSEFVSQNSDRAELYPSAAGIIAYLQGNKLFIANLGDCTAKIIYKNGLTETVYDPSVERLDGKVIERIRQLHLETGCDVCEIVKYPEIRSMLISNRHLMNAPDGYKVLSCNTEKLYDEDILSFDIDDISMVVFYSDGFNAVEDLIIENPNRDFKELYQILRDKENSDPQMNRDPRFKISDDASIISFRFK